MTVLKDADNRGLQLHIQAGLWLQSFSVIQKQRTRLQCAGCRRRYYASALRNQDARKPRIRSTYFSTTLASLKSWFIQSATSSKRGL